MPFGIVGGSHSITTVLPDVDESLGADKPRGPASRYKTNSTGSLDRHQVIPLERGLPSNYVFNVAGCSKISRLLEIEIRELSDLGELILM